MKTFGNSATVGYAETGFLTPCVSSFTAKKMNLLDEVAIEFSTIDGDVVTFHAGTDAVSSGAGIFIGDYFVGISDNPFSLQQAPIVRY